MRRVATSIPCGVYYVDNFRQPPEPEKDDSLMQTLSDRALFLIACLNSGIATTAHAQGADNVMEEFSECQGSCRLVGHAAMSFPTLSSRVSFVGLRTTSASAFHARVLPDHRAGLRRLAAS